jgi:formamidase
MGETTAALKRTITLDRSRSLQDARDGGHTRWHPAIPPLARIAPGEVVRMDARDGGDGQIRPETTAAEAAAYDLDRLHPLTGPFHVEGVEPGDMLEVEILTVEPPDFAWSKVTPGGGGLMRASVHHALVVKWRLEDGFARSDDLPGVAIAAAPFIGTIGIAPAPERLAAIAARERAVADAGGWTLHPSPKNALPAEPHIEQEGLRTLPPREFGGNMDITDVAAGARVSFVAQVPGAMLSIGDLHFAQGDGESYGTAIEMAGTVEFRCSVRQAADLAFIPRTPFIETPTRLITIGTSVTDADDNIYEDLNLATRNALDEMVRHLVGERGFTEAQAQLIVSVAGDLRINVVNNPPNPVVSVALPLAIFDDAA